MTEFDPAALLKQLRSKTPSKVPELPPRPFTQPPEESHSKFAQLEDRVQSLESQLKQSLHNEQKAAKEKEALIQQVKEIQNKANETEARLMEKIKFLEAMLEREKQRNREEKNEDRPRTPVKTEQKRPPFSSAVSSNSARGSGNKQKGVLDLTPLVELYKIMPDFPRPVIKIDFSSVKLN
jgi:DNA repair exonuclease SbcCD ATPase subunit